MVSQNHNMTDDKSDNDTVSCTTLITSQNEVNWIIICDLWLYILYECIIIIVCCLITLKEYLRNIRTNMNYSAGKTRPLPILN